MQGLYELKCPNCGGSIDSVINESKYFCKYCGSRLISIRVKEERVEFEQDASVEGAEEFMRLVIFKRLIDDLAFLQEQYLATKHPSIPIKIANVKNKLIKLNNGGGHEKK